MFYFKKLIRYIFIYGITRAIVKALGRYRIKNITIPSLKRNKFISVIGCGQFSFSTILYFLWLGNKNNFLDCFDINNTNSNFVKKFYSFDAAPLNYENLINNEKCKLVYIASNHNSHSYYASRCLEKNIDVYVEKPISVNMEQFDNLINCLSNSKAKLYSGYNRPFSPSIRYLGNYITNGPLTLNCFISGHKIEKNHWYRNKDEGTRICGNMGHWIDLSVNLMMKRSMPLPDQFDISIVRANEKEIDDNLTVCFTTNFNDIVTITLSSRYEPFEGIRENINILNGKLSATIDDFRKMVLHYGSVKKVKKYFPKDVGHRMSVMQPFINEKRNFDEVVYSTFIMLKIMDMVQNNILNRTIFMSELQDKFPTYFK